MRPRSTLVCLDRPRCLLSHGSGWDSRMRPRSRSQMRSTTACALVSISESDSRTSKPARPVFLHNSCITVAGIADSSAPRPEPCLRSVSRSPSGLARCGGVRCANPSMRLVFRSPRSIRSRLRTSFGARKASLRTLLDSPSHRFGCIPPDEHGADFSSRRARRRGVPGHPAVGRPGVSPPGR